MGKKGEFFAIEKEAWTKVCALGDMNCMVAHLIQACGTGRDNRTSNWSVNAIEKYTSISRGRAKKALERLRDAGCHRRRTLPNGSPQYLLGSKQLSRSNKGETAVGWIWLPNSLVLGADGESQPFPIDQIRETADPVTLRLLVDLYDQQNLAEYGGVDRKLLWQPFDRKRVAERAEWTVWGFGCETTLAARSFVTPFGGADPFYRALALLVDMSLVEWIPHLFESDSPEAEPIHAYDTGFVSDPEGLLAEAAHTAALAMLPEGQRAQAVRETLYLVPVLRHRAKVQMIGVARLRYRAKTTLTASWWRTRNNRAVTYRKIYADLLRKFGRSEAA